MYTINLKKGVFMQNGLLLATLRAKKKLTQKEMATILKVSHSAYKLYEANLRVMKLETLNKISNYYQVSLNSLLNLSSKTYSFNTNQKINYKYFSLNLKMIRKKNHISVSKLSEEFNFSPTTIYKYENNPQEISLTYLYLYAQKFNISIDYLCCKTLKKEIL